MPRTFKTLTERRAAKETESLFEGVPDHLRETLVRVVYSYATAWGGNEMLFSEKVLLLEQMARLPRLIRGVHREQTVDFLEWLRIMEGDDLLQLVDVVLRLSLPSTAEDLNRALRRAGSVFEVQEIERSEDDRRQFALERRESPAVRELIERVDEPRAAAELRAARVDIFGMNPKLDEGLHHCVKAVENASLGVICPGDPKATLGQARAALARGSHAFEVPMRSANAVQCVATMMQVLGESDGPHRHGTSEAHIPTPPTQEEAEMAYSLAVVLCEWFAKGHVKTVAPVA